MTAQTLPEAIWLEMSPSAMARKPGWPAMFCMAWTTCTPVMPEAEVPFQSTEVEPSAFRAVVKPAPRKKEALYQPELRVMPTLLPAA